MRSTTTPGAAAPVPRRGTRAEIQALRAVAVAVVVVYHLHPGALPGGYVGVDVFFVISGFLISRHLVGEAERTGRVELAAFWAGRVRRILPAALVTVVAVVVAASVIMPSTAAAEIGRTSWWATSSTANWFFAAHAVDYLAQTADASPFEHFWSLGVEEQFYLVWPVLVLTAALFARRRAVPIRSRVLVPFVAVLALSFAFGVWFTATGSPAAYFVTPTRMWELAAGGVLAVLLADRQLPPAVALPMQLAGIGAIAGGAVLLDADTPMPGVAALIPVLGALAFVAGGDVPGLRRIWTLRPVRLLGDLSYSLYLWHWPVIVFAIDLLGHPLGLRGAIAVLAVSLLAATASYLLAEQPVRRVRIRHPFRMIAAGGAAIALVVGVGAIPVGRETVLTVDEAGRARRSRTRRPGARSGIRTWTQQRTTRGRDRSTSSSRIRSPSRRTWASGSARPSPAPRPPSSASGETPPARRRSQWSATRTCGSGGRRSTAWASGTTGGS